MPASLPQREGGLWIRRMNGVGSRCRSPSTVGGQSEKGPGRGGRWRRIGQHRLDIPGDRDLDRAAAPPPPLGGGLNELGFEGQQWTYSRPAAASGSAARKRARTERLVGRVLVMTVVVAAKDRASKSRSAFSPIAIKSSRVEFGRFGDRAAPKRRDQLRVKGLASLVRRAKIQPIVRIPGSIACGEQSTAEEMFPRFRRGRRGAVRSRPMSCRGWGGGAARDFPQPMDPLHFPQQRGRAEAGQPVRRDLENNGAEVGQTGDDFRGNLVSRLPGSISPGMRIQPVAVRELHARDMHFPNLVPEEVPGQHVAYPGVSIPVIDP